MNKIVNKGKSLAVKYWKIYVPAIIAAIAVCTGIGIASAADVAVVVQSSTSDYLDMGDTVTLTATATGSDAVGGTFVWESGDSNIALLGASTQNGNTSEVVATATGAGSATITARYVVGGTTYGSGSKDVVVQLVIGNKPTVTLDQNTGDTLTFTTNAAATTTLTWRSSNTSVVTVETVGTSGRVTVVGSGTATLTATATNVVSDSFQIVLKAKVTEPSSPITVEHDETNRLISTNAANPVNLQYVSSDEEVFGITAAGIIVPRTAGEAIAYVYPTTNLVPADGDSIDVVVKFGIIAPATSVAVGNTLQLSSNTSSTGVTWTSSNASVATVNPVTGELTAHSKGTAVIRATLQDANLFSGVIQTAEIQIEIIDSFGLNITENVINVGEEFTIEGIVTDDSASVAWSSSDESVATVVDGAENFTAVVTGVSRGTAIITGTQIIGTVRMTATCEVSVKQPVEDVIIYPTSTTIEIGQVYPMVVVFNPSNADNKNIRWVSSNPAVATVNDSGYVTGITGGTTTISVISEDGLKVANCTLTVRQPVTGITLNQTNVEISESLGQYQLTYTITPSNATNKDVTWTSSNPTVATVSQTGLVTFVAPGTTTIIAKTVDIGTSGNLIATCEFHITVPVSGIELDYDTVTIDVGDTFRLTGTIEPATATNQNVEWTTTDATVATVNASGLITATGSGFATIMARTEDGGYVASCKVVVEQPVTSITLSTTDTTVRKGDYFWLFATVNPSNATNQNIVWSSNNTAVATVDSDGMVTGVEAGDAFITATSADSGVTARCQVVVTQAVTGITLNVNEQTIDKGEKFLIIPNVEPIDATDKTVTYTSSDPEVATVSDNGIVTGITGGTAIIVVQTNERGLIASCQITVNEAATSVEIIDPTTLINNGDAKQLSVEVLPETASNKTVNWYTSNASVITVDSSGRIEGVGYGTATISAIAADGSGAYDTVNIMVIRPVSTITISPSSVSIMQGEFAQVSATVSPSTATVKDIEWSSSDTDIAIVDYTGGITGVNAGTAKIIATATDGSGVIGTCRVTVKKTINASSVTINTSELTLLPGQTQTLTARIKPTSTTETLIWYSGDSSVATVSQSGVVTARGQGNTQVYAMSSYGTVESECDINVLGMNATYISLEQYDSYYLDVFGSTGTINWYSNNMRVATVDTSGRVIARSAGTTTITARANGKLLYCTVRVVTMN